MSVIVARRIVLGLFIAIGLLIFPFISSAEEPQESKPSWEIESSYRNDFRTGAKAQQGSVGISKTDNLIKYEFKAFDKLPIELTLYNRYTSLDSTLSNLSLPANLTEFSTGIQTTLPLFKFDKTYFRLGVEPSFYSDSWDFEPSGFRIPSYYTVIYQPNPKLTLLCGVYVFPDSQDPVLPILGFIYKPNDRLSFNIVPRRPNINYDLTKKISVFAEGSFAIDNEYEVKFDNTRRAVLAFHETYAGTGIKYKFNKYVEASVSGGGTFRRRLKYDDSLGKVNLKDGGYASARVTVIP